MTLEELFTKRFLEMEEKIKKLEGENENLQNKLENETNRADKAEALIVSLQPTICVSDTTHYKFIKIKKDFIFENDDKETLYNDLLPFATEEKK